MSKVKITAKKPQKAKPAKKKHPWQYYSSHTPVRHSPGWIPNGSSMGFKL